MVIYAIIHVRTGRAYIGRTNRPVRRWYEHQWRLRAGRHSSSALQADWTADGSDCFVHVILETLDPLATKTDAAQREQWHLQSTKDPYNQSPSTLSGPTPGVFRHSAESKALMRDRMLGRRASDETRKRISDARKGRSYPRQSGFTLSPETRAKMRATHLGLKGTAESRAKQSAALKGRVFTEEWKAKIRLAKLGKPWSEARRASFEGFREMEAER